MTQPNEKKTPLTFGSLSLGLEGNCSGTEEVVECGCRVKQPRFPDDGDDKETIGLGTYNAPADSPGLDAGGNAVQPD
jgi:hypothetical protein